jgi:hypothetical protein
MCIVMLFSRVVSRLSFWDGTRLDSYLGGVLSNSKVKQSGRVVTGNFLNLPTEESVGRFTEESVNLPS